MTAWGFGNLFFFTLPQKCRRAGVAHDCMEFVGLLSFVLARHIRWVDQIPETQDFLTLQGRCRAGYMYAYDCMEFKDFNAVFVFCFGKAFGVGGTDTREDSILLKGLEDTDNDEW